MYCSRVSTRTISQSRLSARRTSRTSSASRSLSSTWRMRTCLGITGALSPRGPMSSSASTGLANAARRPFVQYGPEDADFPDGFDELFESDRLDDVSVGSEPVALDEIPFLPRGGEHDDRHGLQRVVGLDPAQDLETVQPRHLQVEQDHGRVPLGPEREAAAPKKIIERFFAVARYDDLVGKVILAQRRQRQLDVLRVVLGEQDAFQFSHLDLPSLLRQRKIERGAPIHRSLCPCPPSVPLDDPPDVREPDPRSLELLGAVEALEYTEELVHVLHVETHPVVPDEADDFVGILRDRPHLD